MADSTSIKYETTASQPTAPVSTTTAPLHIAIVGGGIGGLALAVGLLPYSIHAQDGPRNISFTIYESAKAFGEIGAGVGFGANSHLAIKLISPVLWDAYIARATFNGWESKQETWFDFNWGEDESIEKNGGEERIIGVTMRSKETQSTVLRAQFLEELVKLLPEGVASMGKRCTEIVQPEGEETTTTIKFADGTEAKADLVVGADGIRSSVRRSVLGEGNECLAPRFSGKYAYRAMAPMPLAISVLGEEKAQNRNMYLGMRIQFS
jgi:salicylate hydroxylase